MWSKPVHLSQWSRCCFWLESGLKFWSGLRVVFHTISIKGQSCNNCMIFINSRQFLVLTILWRWSLQNCAKSHRSPWRLCFNWGWWLQVSQYIFTRQYFVLHLSTKLLRGCAHVHSLSSIEKFVSLCCYSLFVILYPWLQWKEVPARRSQVVLPSCT